MKILVVGAGIYGITTAVKLSKNNHEVDLVEKNNDILSAASGINQFRIHKGYHYPRSIDTIKSCLNSLPAFEAEYGEAFIKKFNHYYCIAKKGSKTNRENFIRVCEENDLSYKKVDSDLINNDSVTLFVEVEEDLLDPIKLKEICNKNIKDSGVNLILNKEVKREDFDNYDLIVLCTYAISNLLMPAGYEKSDNYQFEICEKIAVRLPKKFNNKSIVIMDGPFMCVDPYGESGIFLMGNVRHAIHHSNIGSAPEIPDQYKDLLNNGIIKNPPVTNFDKFIESTKKFIPEIEKAEHIGSMFTIRTILPRYLNVTDNRPITVQQINNKIISVFSAKLSNCVQVADQVLSIVEDRSK